MRIPIRSTSGGSAYDIPMTPMIDVVFLLLVFFVWTASFQIAEYRLPGAIATPTPAGPSATSVPAETPPPVADFDQVVVRVSWNDGAPAWEVNQVRAPSLAAVRETLQRIATIKADVPVVLHPDSTVPFGYVIDAYDVARLAGCSRVRFAASQSGRRS